MMMLIKINLVGEKKIMIKITETAKTVLGRTTCQITKGGDSREIAATLVVVTSSTDRVAYSGNLVNFTHQQALRDTLVKLKFDAHLTW